MVAKGSDSLGWEKLGITAAGWVAAPMVGALISSLVFTAIHFNVYKSDQPEVKSRKLQPVFLWLCFFVNVLFMLFKGPKGIKVRRWLSIYNKVFYGSYRIDVQVS